MLRSSCQLLHEQARGSRTAASGAAEEMMHVIYRPVESREISEADSGMSAFTAPPATPAAHTPPLAPPRRDTPRGGAGASKHVPPLPAPVLERPVPLPGPGGRLARGTRHSGGRAEQPRR